MKQTEVNRFNKIRIQPAARPDEIPCRHPNCILPEADELYVRWAGYSVNGG